MGIDVINAFASIMLGSYCIYQELKILELEGELRNWKREYYASREDLRDLLDKPVTRVH